MHELLATARQELEEIDFERKYPTCLVHGDMQPENFLCRGEEPILIDWTQSRIDHPFVDLAQYCTTRGFRVDQEQEFLGFYDADLKPSHIFYFGILSYLWWAIDMQHDKRFSGVFDDWRMAHGISDKIHAGVTSLGRMYRG